MLEEEIKIIYYGLGPLSSATIIHVHNYWISNITSVYQGSKFVVAQW